MTNLAHVNRRPRPLKLAGVALALAGGLTLAACQPNDGVIRGPDAELALQTLKAAPEHGFSAERFHVQRIGQLLQSPQGSDQAEGARELRAAVIEYARAQHGLTIPKSAFPKDWGLKPADYDAEASLDQALEAGTFKDWIASQPPPLSAYRVLQRAYVSYLKIEASGGLPAVQPTTFQPLGQGPEVEALRTRLAFEDPQLANAPLNQPADAGLVLALQRFQNAHGLPASGLVDAATLQELNVPARDRAAQIRANLERLRWLPRKEPPTRIDVNIAAAVMDYFVDGKLATHMLAVSGKPGDDETPMLASVVDGVVLNPPWNVPKEIAQEEILPKGEGYLRSKGFVWKDGRLVQQAGPDAALGLVKFEFANPYAVYLHDTPAKAAFQNSQRAVSHGCVRLAQAVDFATTLLSREPGWSSERVDLTLASGETTHVKLTRPVPVRLLYLTAFPQADRIAFRPDIYGWDAELLQLFDHPPAERKPGHRT